MNLWAFVDLMPKFSQKLIIFNSKAIYLSQISDSQTKICIFVELILWIQKKLFALQTD